jgi:hypothetical protein
MKKYRINVEEMPEEIEAENLEEAEEIVLNNLDIYELYLNDCLED